MSEAIKHECGIALLRLLKPLEYYKEKYGSTFYGLNKMYLLMEKQHNRGQDGAGLACIKFDMPPGSKYISIERSDSAEPIRDIFQKIHKNVNKTLRKNPDRSDDMRWLENSLKYCGELFLGHLRYGTFGKNGVDACHPFLRENNWMSKCLALAGNFNLTNVDELFHLLVDIGQHPIDRSDTVTILEKIGHFLDEENERVFRKFKAEGRSKGEISPLIAEHLDIMNILHESCKKWDGGYVIAGLLGHGDAFIFRDPSGIRPAFYYHDDEVVVAASERPVIQTAFNLDLHQIKELSPAHALVIKKDGRVSEPPFTEPLEKKPCSFERIYFSRGTDADIYLERKALGRRLTNTILDKIGHDLQNTVFSYIPNTAETCYLGLLEGLNDYCHERRKKIFLEKQGSLDEKTVESLLSFSPRREKITVKDAKLRTFITDDKARNDLVAHVYDITYGSIVPGRDSLVVMDDSIVRGTTLKESILRILDRLGPLRVIFVSSAPQIRYPDCYGIDMSRLDNFVAFEAAVELLKESGRGDVIRDVYDKCKSDMSLPKEQVRNNVKDIYRPFSAEEISEKISTLLTPPGMKAKVEIVYQSIENLHKACPNHKGDWYFTGNYPTPGGNKVANQSFINYVDGSSKRAY